MRASERSCEEGEPPCLAASFRDGGFHWTASGHVGREYIWATSLGRVEVPEPDDDDWTPVALPLSDGGWLVQRGSGQVERYDVGGGRISLGVLPRLGDLAESAGRLWLLGERVWVIEEGRLRALEGLPAIGVVSWLEPMDGGRVANATEAGVLPLQMSPP